MKNITDYLCFSYTLHFLKKKVKINYYHQQFIVLIIYFPSAICIIDNMLRAADCSISNIILPANSIYYYVAIYQALSQ